MNTFITLFNAQNVHLIKDVGLIPYGMYYYEHYESYVATYDNGEYKHLQDSVKGLKTWFIRKYTGSFTFDGIIFLIKNSKKIDILNLYHTTLRSALFSLVYKHVNPSGKIYLKLDGGFTREETPWYKSFRRYAIYKADLVTTELRQTQEAMVRSWNRKIELLRNPFHPSDLKEFVPYSNRSNTILTVGRIGTPPKNTETLLNAFISFSEKENGWKLSLVGSIESDFMKHLNELFCKMPDLKEKIDVIGNIDDRDKLMSVYSGAKIFAFPSRWESYGIALMEAGLCGTFQICSDLLASKELTNNFGYAAHFPAEDENKLSELLESYCLADDFEIERMGKNEREYIVENCSLEEVSKQLNKMINEL